VLSLLFGRNDLFTTMFTAQTGRCKLQLGILISRSGKTGFPMSAHLSRLRLFQRHLRSLVWVWVWVWDGCRVWVSTSSSPPHPSHTLTQSLDSYCRPTAGKSSRPAGLSTLIYAYVVDCAPASPCVRYIWSSAPLFCFCKNK